METQTELHGWKKIASHLSVDPKTARKYFKQLGLPVHKVGGRYVAYAEELDQWKRNHQNHRHDARPGLRPPHHRRYLVWALPGLLALGALVVVLRVSITNAIPASAALAGDRFEVFDAGGRRLWVEELPGVDTDRKPLVLIRDVNGDGRPEVLLDYYPSPSHGVGGRLVCFSPEGEVLWEFPYSTELTVRGRYFHPLYVSLHVEWLESPEGPFVLVVARHEKFYPTRLILLDPLSGDLRAEYWHPGYIEAITRFDVDGDGADELVAGGINNPGEGPGYASLAVLDVPFRDSDPGISSFFDRPGVSHQGSNALERAYLLFPSPDYLAVRAKLVGVLALQVQGPDRLAVTVGAKHMGEIDYVLDRDLRVLEIWPSDALRHIHAELYNEGVLDHSYYERELEDWGKAVLFPTAPDGNSPEVNKLFEQPAP